MKNAEHEMRVEYKRTDFANLERGKFFKEASKGTSVALIEPKLAKAFPTAADKKKAASKQPAKTNGFSSQGLLRAANTGSGYGSVQNCAVD